jgi:HAD superfamily hydrolase (TIGR01509 family)
VHELELRSVLAGSTTLLLWFDGVVCTLYTGMSAGFVASALSSAGGSITRASTGDPLDALRGTSGLDRAATWRLETAARDLELAAATSAAPLAGAHDTIRAARAGGRLVAVVGDTSAEAIERYLTLQGLTDQVDAFLGRPFADPVRMTPDPYLVEQALAELGEKPDHCALVGATEAAMQSAKAARVRRIGVVASAGRRRRLLTAGAEVVARSMTEVRQHLAP